MHTVLRRMLQAVVCLLALTTVAAAQGTVTDLGTLGGTSSFPLAVNSSGQIAGYATLPGDTAYHAFSWKASTGMVDLGTLGGSNSQAIGISTSGLVAGNSDALEPDPYGGPDPWSFNRAFVWTAAGGMIDLTGPGTTSSVVDVNGAGQVVGTVMDLATFETRAFFWSAATGLVDIGMLPGANYITPTVMSETGQVAGYTYSPLGEQRGFSWTADGGIVDIGSLGGSQTFVAAVSDAGHVAGYSFLPGDAFAHAFTWTPAGGMIDLGTLGGPASEARDVNSAGQVVGVAIRTDGDYHAFSWTQAGGMVDLDTLGGVYSEANYVTPSGLVVGRSTVGTTVRVFAWSGSSLIDVGTAAGSEQTFTYGRPSATNQIAGYACTDALCTGVSAFAWTPTGGSVALPSAGTGNISEALLPMADGRYAGVANFELNAQYRAVILSAEMPDADPPVITVATATPELWPPDGGMVNVTFTGTATDAGSGISSVTFEVIDEYGRVQPAGSVTLAQDGTFSVTVRLEAQRNGTDKDGRRYEFVVTATNNRGNVASKSALTFVVHDRGKKKPA